MVINPIVGVYIPIIRIPINGGMTIPNIATFDHGTDQLLVDLEVVHAHLETARSSSDLADLETWSLAICRA